MSSTPTTDLADHDHDAGSATAVDDRPDRAADGHPLARDGAVPTEVRRAPSVDFYPCVGDTIVAKL